MDLQKAAKVFGVVFLLVGVMGFIPGVTSNGHLLGIFHVDAVHNMVHLGSGIAALATGFANQRAARLYCQIFGVVYALVTILGFLYGDRDILGIMANNMGDVVLHILIAATSLLLGFGPFGEDEAEAERS
jgi:hypothetical protein